MADAERHRITIKHTYGRSLPDLIGFHLSEEPVPADAWIEMSAEQNQVFRILNDSLRQNALGYGKEYLVFSRWDSEVENLDSESDPASCWRMSMHLRWEGVDLNLDEEEFRAPNLERLKEALAHVAISSWNSCDT